MRFDLIMIMILAPVLGGMLSYVAVSKLNRRDARREWEATHDGLRWEDWKDWHDG